MSEDTKQGMLGIALIIGILSVGIGIGHKTGKHYNDEQSYINGVCDGFKIFEALRPERVKFF